MPKAATKTKKKSSTKSSSSSAAHLAAHRERHQREREHVKGKLKTAHTAVLSVIDKVKADDAEGIAKLRRAVEHAHDNATMKAGR